MDHKGLCCMYNRRLVNISFKLVSVWILLSIVGLVFANEIISPFLPFFATIIDKISPDYTSAVSIDHYQNADRIMLFANLIHPIRLSGDKYFPPGSALVAGSDVVHTLVPMVLLFTLLLAWPVKKFTERVILLAVGIPLLFLVMDQYVKKLKG